MTLDELTSKVKIAVGADSGLGKALKFDLRGAGFVHIDGGVVTNEDKPADLTLSVGLDDLAKIYRGELNAMAAFSNGAVTMSNPMLAMSLGPKLRALLSKVAAPSP
jgi:putative sterol carrier protein